MLMPEIFEETFQHLGTCMSLEYLQLLKCEPNCKVWFEDGEYFATSTDIAHMKREIEKVEGPSGFERFVAYLEECQQHYQQSVIHVLEKDFPVFSLGSMYLGMSPFEIPGTYTLLQYAELVGGVWYPVLERLLQIGTRLGVEYHLSVPVETVTVSRGKALGVSLESSTLVEADAVIINADLIYAFKALLPPNSSTSAALNRGKNVSCSSIYFYWSLSKTFPQLETHNMFVESSFGKRSTHVYMERQSPMKTSFYVHVPSRIDPTAAPAGKDAVIVLVLVDNLGDADPSREGFDDLDLVSYARDHVISSIEKRTGTIGFNTLIDHESVNTPSTWQESFNSEKGGIFGLDHSLFNILSFRPKIKHDSVAGVYFVGASTHPGAGVPTCLAGARLTAERVLKDLEVAVPWETSNTQSSHACSRFFTRGLLTQPLWKWILFSIPMSMVLGLVLAGTP
ncbi:Phytoene desaturase [Penicillium sp. IBT 16267x]|nr:Phytoene desaturase [Penicillium sp. IBT 16267x]